MLFRKEAVSHQSERLTGDISLAQPLSMKLTVGILTTIAVLIVTFLFNAQYSRKETVRGFLMPNKGVIKSFAAQGGTIEKLWVKEGEVVEKGQTLATMIIQQRNSDGIELSAQLAKQLQTQQSLLQDEIKQHQTLKTQELDSLASHQQTIKLEQLALKSQLQLANEKAVLLQGQLTQFSNLNAKGYLSNLDKGRQEQALLEAKQEQQNLNRLLLQQSREVTQLAHSIETAPQQYTLRINNLIRQQSEITRQLAQVDNHHQYTITASNSGTVTGIQVVEGESLSRTKPLLHILPAGSTLVAELLLPTRSAGFVKEGHHARLRFDAFPYQRFGFINSEINRVDRALITPNEVQLPITLQEPVYRLRAQLDVQHVKAFGKDFNLKSGMLFEADIMLEQRTLIEWLLEPLYSLKGRVN